MSQYGVTAQLNAAANKPMLLLFGDGVVLPEVNLIRIGFSSAPADQLFKFGLFEHTDAGSGGVSVNSKPLGPAASAGCTAKRGAFSTDPTRSGTALVSLTCHHRAVATIQKEFGAGYRPQAINANRGLGIWCDVAPASAAGEYTLNWWE